MKIPTRVIASVLLLAVAAQADWNIGDPYKMHYPQLPDPNGWDVAFNETTLADDFLCTENGPISEIHLWTSWREDLVNWDSIQNIHLSIHSDNPQGPNGWSQPDELLWETDIGKSFVAREYGIGDQSWYDPLSGQYMEHDHQGIWQINITDIQAPFIQQQGTIYWLDVRIDQDPAAFEQIGWKTTQDHWNDDGVFDENPDPLFENWVELRDPRPGFDESLDFAFVAVPEPSVMALFGLCGLGLFIRKRLMI